MAPNRSRSGLAGSTRGQACSKSSAGHGGGTPASAALVTQFTKGERSGLLS
jgi:hypothetical protein